jgi:hypothetical protein
VTELKLPKRIAGVPVEPHGGEPMELRGERWQTMIPKAEDDDRLWEFSLTTGRILQLR